MRKIIILLFSLVSTFANAQYCKDSTRIDTYYQCGQLGSDYFDPVCGCDNVTYRNACAAENWGGLYYNAWTNQSVCGNFAFDFRPTALSYSSPGNFPARFQLFLNNPSGRAIPITVYIYDDFGKLWFTWNRSTSTNGKFPSDPEEFKLQSLRMGIYLMIVVVNNEMQSLKFSKLTNDESAY